MSFQPSNRNQFVWEIPNFSLLTQRSKAVLNSEVYHSINLFRTEWKLKLCISGPEEQHSVSLYVERCNSDSDTAPVDLFLQLEACFLDGAQREYYKRYMKANFRKDSKRGFVNFLNRNTIIDARKHLLPKDKLTVQCCVWKCSMDEIIPNFTKISASIELEQPFFMWILGGFREWQPGTRRGIFVLSDLLSGSFEMYGMLHLEASDNEPNKHREELRISIQPEIPPSKQIFVFAKVSVLDKFQKPGIVLKGQNFFEPLLKIPWHLGTIVKSELTDPSAHLVDYNHLNMRCDFVVADGKRATETRNCLIPLMEALCSNTKTLLKDIKSYESAAFPDIKLKVEGELFPAHRVILGSRSPVFKEVFKKAEDKIKRQEQLLECAATFGTNTASGSVYSQEGCQTLPLDDSDEDSDDHETTIKFSTPRRSSHGDSTLKFDKSKKKGDKGTDRRISPSTVTESDSDVVPIRVRKRCLPLVSTDESKAESESDSSEDHESSRTLSLDSVVESKFDKIKIKQEPVDSEPETAANQEQRQSNEVQYRRRPLRTLHIDSPSSASDDSMGMENYVRSLAFGIGGNSIQTEPESNDDVLESSHDITIRMTNDGYVADIAQIDRETMRHMLKFMYTDTLEGLDVDRAVKLFVAGQKYQLQYMVEKCEDYLKSSVNFRSFIFLLTLSDIISIASLKKATIDFIEGNLTEILMTEEWRYFAERQADLAGRVMQYIKHKSRYPADNLPIP